jgi:hypothetical protein
MAREVVGKAWGSTNKSTSCRRKPSLVRCFSRPYLPNQIAQHVRGPGWRLDLFANTIAHERAKAALSCFAAPALGGGKAEGGSSGDPEAGGRKWAGTGAPGEGLWRALSGCRPPGAGPIPCWLAGQKCMKTAAGQGVYKVLGRSK